MHHQQPQTLAEVSTPEAKRLTTLQAQLALHGVELHPVPGVDEAALQFTVNVHGALRTLSSLQQVQDYARCIGIATC